MFSLHVYAGKTIRITVKTDEHTATGIGYSVEGRASGTLGRTYHGRGVTNKEYVFGYRKHTIMGININCGSSILTKDSTIILVMKGDKCINIVGE